MWVQDGGSLLCEAEDNLWVKKMSKTADLDATYIQIFLHLHVLCIWLVAGDGQLLRVRGVGRGASPPK